MSAGLFGKRVFVTGATGFIGGHVARRLAMEGSHVLALERTPGKGHTLAHSGIEVVTGDIADRARMEEIICGDVQIVMHIAAWLRGHPFENYQIVNIDATRHLADISAQAGVNRFVFTSSITVYGMHGAQDVDESTRVAPYGDLYADSKIVGEQALKSVSQRLNLPTVIVRPGMVYGPGSPGWTIRLARWAKRGMMPLVDGGRGAAYPIFIDNLVDLLILAATHPKAVGETFNGVDDGPVSLAEYLGAYMQMIPTNRAARLPGWLIKAAARGLSPLSPGLNLNYIASQLSGVGQVSNHKANHRLGWKPEVSLSEGLQRSQKWLRDEGYL